MSNEFEYLIVDCDGTLTDGLYHVCSDGKITKSFNTRDFDAIDRIQKLGIQVIIITKSIDRVVNKKAEGNNIHCLSGINNKVETIEYILKGNSDWSKVAYIGDAENDIEAMKLAGFSACPSDAIDEAKNEADLVSLYGGGKGAVREIIKHLAMRMGHEWLIESKSNIS